MRNPSIEDALNDVHARYRPHIAFFEGEVNHAADELEPIAKQVRSALVKSKELAGGFVAHDLALVEHGATYGENTDRGRALPAAVRRPPRLKSDPSPTPCAPARAPSTRDTREARSRPGPLHTRALVFVVANHDRFARGGGGGPLRGCTRPRTCGEVRFKQTDGSGARQIAAVVQDARTAV